MHNYSHACEHLLIAVWIAVVAVVAVVVGTDCYLCVYVCVPVVTLAGIIGQQSNACELCCALGHFPCNGAILSESGHRFSYAARIGGRMAHIRRAKRGEMVRSPHSNGVAESLFVEQGNLWLNKGLIRKGFV